MVETDGPVVHGKMCWVGNNDNIAKLAEICCHFHRLQELIRTLHQVIFPKEMKRYAAIFQKWGRVVHTDGHLEPPVEARPSGAKVFLGQGKRKFTKLMNQRPKKVDEKGERMSKCWGYYIVVGIDKHKI